MERESKGRIMFVEDEDEIRRLGRRVLESQGYEVEDFSHGLSAFRKLVELKDEEKQDYYKMIFSDIDMPQMDGIAFATEAGKLTESPLVLMTGMPRPIYPANVREVLVKPFNMSEYKRVLDKYVR